MTVVTGGGRRERTKERNRAAILSAARAAFASAGYGGTAVRDIVRRTDLSPGTFYNYFRDKESIIPALVEESTTRVRARLREGRAGARGGVGRASAVWTGKGSSPAPTEPGSGRSPTTRRCSSSCAATPGPC